MAKETGSWKLSYLLLNSNKSSLKLDDVFNTVIQGRGCWENLRDKLMCANRISGGVWHPMRHIEGVYKCSRGCGIYGGYQWDSFYKIPRSEMVPSVQISLEEFIW